MATRIAECITQKLLASSVIEEGDRELYNYGFFLLITRFFFFIITVLAGLLASIPGASVLFYMVFMSLRTYAGGVHARTEAACTILTTLALTLSVLGIKVLEQANSKLIPMLMLVIGSLCIYQFSPLDTKEKPLECSEKKHYHAICCALVSLCIIVAIIAETLSFDVVFYSVASGMFLESILLCIGNKRNNL